MLFSDSVLNATSNQHRVSGGRSLGGDLLSGSAQGDVGESDYNSDLYDLSAQKTAATVSILLWLISFSVFCLALFLAAQTCKRAYQASCKERDHQVGEGAGGRRGAATNQGELMRLTEGPGDSGGGGAGGGDGRRKARQPRLLTTDANTYGTTATCHAISTTFV